MVAVLLSGREDWYRRIAYFAFFGALGWSFGGSISYMQVIAYTHSGHSGSVLYGFACLFVIGFLWAAMGGAGTALPAVLNRDRLTEFFAPLTAVFIAWCLQDFAEYWLVAVNPDFRQESPLYWYDTDWLAALLAIVAVIVLALIRRRFDVASSLILHMAIGWASVISLGWEPPVNLIDRVVRERHNEQIAIGSGLYVGANAKVGPDDQALAFRNVELGRVIGHAVLESRIGRNDVAAVASESKSKQVTIRQIRPGSADE